MVVIKNDGNIPVPDHLNEEFFISALEEGLFESKISLHEINFEFGSVPGENYCSSIYRVLVTFSRWVDGKVSEEKEQRSLIVKAIIITPETKFLEEVNVFIKEKNFYTHVLPRLETLSQGEKFGATYYYSLKAPVQTIVFSDLNTEGFKLASRQTGLDFNHASLILEQLGKFHATSMVLAKKDPQIMEKFPEGMLGRKGLENIDSFDQVFSCWLKQLVKESQTWPGYENISKHLQRMLDNLREVLSCAGESKPNDRYLVLNHGDFWTNNFMFNYDDKKRPGIPTRAILLDFQVSWFGSPGCDLNFLFNSSMKLPVLKERRDDLIKKYYKAFRDTLEYARFETIPRYEDLLYEIRSREVYGLFSLFCFLPLVTMPKELSHDNTLDKMSDDDFQKKKMTAVFKQESLNDYLKFCLKRAEEIGVFNDF